VGVRRRGTTVAVGAVLVALLTLLVGQAPVPYVQLEPGPTYDTLGQDTNGKDVIEVNGAPTSTSKGQLRFLTVGVLENLTLLDALRGWLRSDDAVVPRELIIPPNLTNEQVDQQNKQDFVESQSAAEVAALVELGYPVKITVKEVNAGFPADGVLQAGDVITSVDGKPIVWPHNLTDPIRNQPVGTTLTLGITRNGTPMTVQVKTKQGTNGLPQVGIVQDLSSTAPFTVDIPIEGIGGPSAGLMLALGIADKLKPEDLTGGKIIAGTGTIDPDGNVGPIGGVPQKLLGARNAGATIFLTPDANCAEAVANAKPGLLLVQVKSLDQALAALDTLRSGGQPTLCPGAKA
jgi:Lon-like protease